MWFSLILTVVTVSARNAEDNIRDRYLPQANADFGSLGALGYDRRDGFSSVNSGRHYDRPEFHDQRSFSREFNRRQFYHSSSDNGNDRGFGGSHNFDSFNQRGRGSSHDFGSNFDSQSGFHQRGDRRGIETLEQNFGLESAGARGFRNNFESRNFDNNFGSDSIGARGFQNNFESKSFENNFGSDSIGARGFQNNFNSKRFQNNFVTDISTQGFLRQSTENPEPTASHDSVDTPKINHEVQSQGDVPDKSAEDDKHEKVTNQRKAEVELISTNIKRKVEQPEDTSKRTSDLKIQQNTEQHLRTNIQKINTTVASRNESTKDNQNVTTQNRTEPITNRPMTFNNNVTSHTTDTKTTTDNEVVVHTDENKNRGNQSRAEDDKWIWDGGQQKNESTTFSPKAVDLDDRAAFNGDKCPTGTVRIGYMCVAVD